MQFFNKLFTRFDIRFTMYLMIFAFLIILFAKMELYAHPRQQDKSGWLHLEPAQTAIHMAYEKDQRERDKYCPDRMLSDITRNTRDSNCAQSEGSRAGDRK